MQEMKRREALGLLAAAACLPQRAFAAERVDLGTMQLVTLSDGHLTLPANLVFAPVADRDLLSIVSEFGIADLTAPLTPPCNVTLIRSGDRTILFDCGAGPTFQASAGRLIDALATEGLSPEDITDLVFTHAHPDHLWGVLDDFDEPLFLNASHWMGREERDYWVNPETIDSIGTDRQSFAVGAARRLEAIESVLQTFEDGDEILPGVAAHLTPGHTPGHVSFEVASGGQSAMIIGDAIANDHISLARPDWPTGSDQDLETGAVTRARLVERLASEDMIAVGFHLSEGGIGRIVRVADGFRFLSEV
jgi:glyoxylase-like metal-dependent hydrolase (beta-lactamase superfamily II)